MNVAAKYLQFGHFVLLILFFSVMNISCTRMASTQSQIKIKVPSQTELSKSSSSVSMLLADGKKLCFAVNVVGDGIAQHGVCGQDIGAFAGFVDQDQTISLTLDRGNNRTFKLLGSVTDSTSICPSLEDIQNNKLLWADLYTAGSVSNVTLDREEIVIEIPVTLNSNSIGATSGIAECGEQPGIIRAALLSNGDIVDENLNPLSIDVSLPIWESITYGLGLTSVGGWTYLTSSDSVAEKAESETTPTFTSLSMMPHVRSLTQKPDSREFFGLYHDGQIVSVDPVTGQVTENTTCPLEVCQVPEWVQSISVGSNLKVFALDHAGNIYQVKNTNGSPTMTYLRSVSPIVSQVVFY